ncbi:hypothetical protein diail_6474 [Diaporthe ilicicola]|nr:hypothetical protein diail_6474 [Diaporthe ilicicola]
MSTGEYDDVGSGRGLGPIWDVDFAPPKHSADYETKPLPAIPPRTSLSIPDLKNALKTPKRSLNKKQYVYDWDRQGDDIPVMADGRSGTPRSRSLPENDTNGIPTTPSNEILSPQPRHSRQKILRLTGNISPSMSLASFSPSLHNSPQKIKKLTGFDVGSSSSIESQPQPLQHPFQDEVSPVSPTSSTHSTEGLEATISEPDSDASEYSLHSNPNGVMTQLTAPSYGNSSSRPSSRPISTAPVSPTTKLRLSSFAMREPDTSSPRGSLTDFKAHYRHSSNAGSWGSRKSSATVVPHYASGSDTTKCSPRTSANMTGTDVGPSSPSFKQRSLIWDTSPVELLTADGHSQTSPSSSPPPPSLSASGNLKPGSLSERRASRKNRVPTPLEPNGELLKPGKFGLPQRTPYPPPSSTKSAFDSDEDSGKRTSILAKVFGGGGGSGSSSKRQSRGPTPSSSPSPFGGGHKSPAASARGHLPPAPPESPLWSEGPDVRRSPIDPTAAAVVAGRPLSAGASGLFQRARQSMGLRSRADKRRENLRGNIRVVET